MTQTPRSLGYYMPAEWHPHRATWLAWPKNTITWPGDRLEAVQEVHLRWMELLAQVETVCLLVDDDQVAAEVGSRLAARGVPRERLRCWVLPTVDAWIRDYGPNFLISRRDRGRACNCWRFNAWGDKYPELVEDSRVPALLAPQLGLPVFRPEMVLEGGSIDVNGGGLCLTTRQCLLHPNRNPHLTRDEIVIWLNQGIVGDDTDGHVDDIARFTDHRTVLCAVEEDPADPNYPMLQENFELLKRYEMQGQFRVEPLVMPEPVWADGERLPASYANFYIANGLVCVPQFGQARDRRAREQIQAAFPRHRVVGLPASDLVWGMGTLHCLSQQEPAGSRGALSAHSDHADHADHADHSDQ
jgi:agmatine deiminase